jgi:outer membrane protein assembly factor BamB
VYQTDLFSLDNPGPIHPLNSHATPTPVVESGRLFADFGAYGTACLDTTTGRSLWITRLAVDHQLGPASSLAAFQDWLYLVRDGCDVQYVAALAKETGREVWRTPRPPIKAESGPFKKSFSTPLIVQHGGQTQVIAVGPHWVVAYEPASGRELWRVRHGKGYSIAPRPVFGHGLVYVCTGDYVAQLWAIRVDGQGDVTDTHVVWKATSQIPLMSSPLLVGDELYFVSDTGIGSCVDALRGTLHWRERLGGNYAASPVLAEGRIYFFSREGRTVVLQPGQRYTTLAESQLDGTVIATPAVVGNTILLRSDTHLYRIQDPNAAS